MTEREERERGKRQKIEKETKKKDKGQKIDDKDKGDRTEFRGQRQRVGDKKRIEIDIDRRMTKTCRAEGQKRDSERQKRVGKDRSFRFTSSKILQRRNWNKR